MDWLNAGTETAVDDQGRAWEIALMRRTDFRVLRVTLPMEAVRASAHVNGECKFTVTASAAKKKFGQTLKAVRDEARRRIEQRDWQTEEDYPL